MNKGGRPVGSTTRPQLRSHLSQKQIDTLVDTAYDVAINKKDVGMLKFIMEQVYGKASQNLDITSDGEQILIPIYGKQSIPGYEGHKENLQSNKEDKSS